MVHSDCGRIMRSVRRQAGSPTRRRLHTAVVDAEKAAKIEISAACALHQGQATTAVENCPSTLMV